ncbi:MAG: 30S ribosomal protein S20 [candidate division WOR-3 bacterium]
MAKRTKSAIKNVRKTAKRRLRNRSRRLALKTAIRRIRSAKSREEAQKLFPEVQATIDRAARHHIIHTNAARRLKARITRDMAFMK